MRTWVFLFLVPWPVAGSSQNWSAPPIALSQVGIREKQNHPFSLLPFLVPGVWGTFPVVLESRGSVSHWQFQSWLHFISTSCNAIKTSWEVFLGVSKQSFPDTVLLLAVPGQDWQVQQDSCCRAVSNAWHLSFHPGYSCKVGEGQQGKSYCWSHRAQSWSFRSPTLTPFLSYFETSREVRGSWGFSLPFFSLVHELYPW